MTVTFAVEPFVDGVDIVVSIEKAAAIQHRLPLRFDCMTALAATAFEPDRDQDGRDGGKRQDNPDERVPAHRSGYRGYM